MSRRSWMRAARALGSVALLGVIAYLVWPVRLGGGAMFVVVRGDSMEPTYHQGDLLYARTASSYAPGDIAVYRVPKGAPGAGSLVVHRIEAIRPDGSFVFLGDNKDAVDDATPTRADVVGVPMLNLGPLPTRALVVAPIVFTILTGIAVTVALWPSRPPLVADPDADVEPDDADVAEPESGALAAPEPEVEHGAVPADAELSPISPTRIRRPWGARPYVDAPAPRRAVEPVVTDEPTPVG